MYTHCTCDDSCIMALLSCMCVCVCVCVCLKVNIALLLKYILDLSRKYYWDFKHSKN